MNDYKDSNSQKLKDQIYDLEKKLKFEIGKNDISKLQNDNETRLNNENSNLRAETSN